MRSSSSSVIAERLGGPLAAALLLAAHSAAAAGFAVGEQGAAAFGLAGAATARDDLPEQGYYNPAVWVRKSGFFGTVGGTAVAPSMRHTDPTTGTRTAAITSIATPPYAHAAYGFGTIGVGITFGVPFGSSLAWPDARSWVGRFEITEIDLTTFELAPTVAVALHPKLSVAAGARLVEASVYMARKIDAVTQEGSVELGGDGVGLGGQAAVLAGPFGPVQLGMTYRSRVAIGFSGNANFENVPAELSTMAHDGPVKTSLTLPDRISAGAALTLGSSVLSFDAEYFAWHTFRRLVIDFTDAATPDVTQRRDWHDTVALRAGFEQRKVLGSLTLRAGIAYDPTPAPADTLSPSLPDSNRLLVSIGGSYPLRDGLAVHLGLGHVFFATARSQGTEALPATYQASAELVSLGLSYQ